MGILERLGRYLVTHPNQLIHAVDALEKWTSPSTERSPKPVPGVPKGVPSVPKPSKQGVSGRPRAEVDLREAERLLSSGMSLGAVAKKLGIPKTTLWRALRDEKS